MQTKSINKRKVLLFAGLLLLVIVVIVALFIFNNSAHAHSNSASYPKNADGLSYGSMSDAQSADAVPDLIAVVATNGQEGYVYKTDYNAAMQVGMARNPDHAVWLMAQRSERIANAFVDSIESQTGPSQSTISLENERADLGNVILDLDTQSGDISFEELSTNDQANIISDLPDGIDQSIVDNAWAKANKVDDQVLPVYSLDGKTIIGEFIIE